MIITFVSNEGSRRDVSCIAMRPQFNPHACMHTHRHKSPPTKWLRDKDIRELENTEKTLLR